MKQPFPLLNFECTAILPYHLSVEKISKIKGHCSIFMTMDRHAINVISLACVTCQVLDYADLNLVPAQVGSEFRHEISLTEPRNVQNPYGYCKPLLFFTYITVSTVREI